MLMSCASPGQGEQAPAAEGGEALVVVTFNTGSSGGYDPEHSGAFGAEQAAALDEWYGNGLAWGALVDEVRAWFATVDPDIVALQEVFWPGDCAGIPTTAWPGFICDGWTEGDPTVVEAVLGPSYQVACNLDHPDKCLAVHTRVGRFAGCEGTVCLDGLDGAEIETCGNGARVGRGTVLGDDGGEPVVVGVHGSSGLTSTDEACRVAQFTQVFDDLDGEPAANGEANVILGDFNTDPGRWTEIDTSAAYLAEHVVAPLHFVTEVGPDAEPTYALANIDHVITDAYTGTCWHGGLDGHAEVSEMGILDHRPAVCTLIR